MVELIEFLGEDEVIVGIASSGYRLRRRDLYHITSGSFIPFVGLLSFVFFPIYDEKGLLRKLTFIWFFLFLSDRGSLGTLVRFRAFGEIRRRIPLCLSLLTFTSFRMVCFGLLSLYALSLSWPSTRRRCSKGRIKARGSKPRREKEVSLWRDQATAIWLFFTENGSISAMVC